MPLAVGVPLIVSTLLVVFSEAVKPAGRLAMVTEAAEPPMVYEVPVMALPSHTVWFCVAAVEVRLMVDLRFLVTVPDMLTAVQGAVCPVVVMV